MAFGEFKRIDHLRQKTGFLGQPLFSARSKDQQPFFSGVSADLGEKMHRPDNCCSVSSILTKKVLLPAISRERVPGSSMADFDEDNDNIGKNQQIVMQMLSPGSGLRCQSGLWSAALTIILLLAATTIQASAASLTVERSTVCEGSWLNASFVLPYPEDQPPGDRDDGGYGVAALYDLSTDQQVGGTVYGNNGEGREVKISLRAPHKLGDYEFRLFRDPYTQILLAKSAVEVTACKPAGAYIDTPTRVCIGESANITVWLPVEEDDRFDGSGFAALYRVGTDEEVGGTRSGVNDGCMGSCIPRPVQYPLVFQVLAGEYEWRMFGDYYGQYLLESYPVQVIDCAASGEENGVLPEGDHSDTGQQASGPKASALTCDRLVLDLEEADNSAVRATVVDACQHEPLKDASLNIRVFHTYDARSGKAINGEYVDLMPRLTDEMGQARIQVDGRSGDIYRVDVYASKEGWDTSERSIHVTIGGSIGDDAASGFLQI
ncbi:MAG: hypothetical protein A4E45_00891 [Methanosaeta sp. PtaB.Bin039]|nr:MAG: hypothetical protein A4E45_00891 [Methanosaeta sp. PtaB.Bin039]